MRLHSKLFAVCVCGCATAIVCVTSGGDDTVPSGMRSRLLGLRVVSEMRVNLASRVHALPEREREVKVTVKAGDGSGVGERVAIHLT